MTVGALDIFPTGIGSWLEGIEDRAREDGQAGMAVNGEKRELIATVRLHISWKISEGRARCMYLREKIKQYSERVSKLQESITSLGDRVDQERKAGLLRGVLYTVAGSFFIVGDIALAYDLLIRTWGLGNANPLHTWSLVVALGLTPIIGELIFARFIESRYNHESGNQPRIVRWFFLIAALFILLSFGYFGFLRGIVMTYMQTHAGRDIYGPLLASYPYLNVIAFVLMALLFIVGGAVLLTAGMNELSRHHCYRRDRKEIQALIHEEEEVQHVIDGMKQECSRISVQLEGIESEQEFERMVEDQATYYEGKYLATYKRSLKQALTNPGNALSLDGRFHHFGQAVMDQTAVNDAVESFLRKEQSNGR
ncbi:MAG: hypothetical protein IIA60_00540 [Candidatus Marinimicrobia bacterium]|nr:hypothetical protein [Candidatus Neomarinimicrobiota bacterium]